MPLGSMLPDCQFVYYVKQLSPSDAACSKQIKLPKTEAKRFCGELRHKQSVAVVSMPPPWPACCACKPQPGSLIYPLSTQTYTSFCETPLFYF